MNIDILKNPIVIGILMALITFGYLYWDDNQKQKKNPNIKKKKYNIVTPLIVGVFTWFITANYFDSSCSNTIKNIVSNNNMNTNIDIPQMQVQTQIMKSDGIINSIYEPNYESNLKIVGENGINVPMNIEMPEMFIELDGFS